MNFRLKVWRQPDAKVRGKLVDYEVRDISPNTSFLEMLDTLNEELLGQGDEPIAFDPIAAKGFAAPARSPLMEKRMAPDHPGAVCELYMRKFRDGARITVEPFRVGSFPIIKDLVIDRSALDRIVQAGGFISARAGSAPEAEFDARFPSTTPTSQWKRRPASAVEACAAACPNGSAMLFTAAKVSHLSLLPQGNPERTKARFENGARDGRRGIWQLHQHLRVRSGLSR